MEKTEDCQGWRASVWRACGNREKGSAQYGVQKSIYFLSTSDDDLIIQRHGMHIVRNQLHNRAQKGEKR